MAQIPMSSAAAVTVVAIAAVALQLILMPPFAGHDPTSLAPMPNCVRSSGGVEVPYLVGHPSSSTVCKSNHSERVEGTRRGAYTCKCKESYHGDPYLTDGCKETPAEYYRRIPASLGAVVNGRIRFPGSCIARDAICKSKQSHCASCQCNDGHHGNPYVPGGCKADGRVKSFKGIRIIIIVASGTCLILLPLIAYYISYKIKNRRAQMLKQKYVQRNRRQLLQRLAPQRADIAEKMVITLEELEKATNNFDEALQIGGGGHGIIYKGVVSDLPVVAIKKPKMVNQKEIDEFINEVAILSQINHRNVVKLYGCCLETEVPMLVYEFISKGTLHDHLYVEGPRSLSWDDRLRISTEVAKSLSYLHSTTLIPIIHRDIKPANILLDDTLTAKLADFGSARYIPLDRSGLTTIVQGTRGYMDPIYWRTCLLTEKSDVYSFGVMLIEVMTRKKPFTYITSEGDGLVAHFATLFAEDNLSQILDPQVMDEGGSTIKGIAGIAVACVKSSREERPTMRQVELRLEAAQPPEEIEANGDSSINSSSTRDGRSIDRLTSRQYSLEEEYILSARYPR